MWVTLNTKLLIGVFCSSSREYLWPISYQCKHDVSKFSNHSRYFRFSKCLQSSCPQSSKLSANFSKVSSVKCEISYFLKRTHVQFFIQFYIFFYLQKSTLLQWSLPYRNFSYSWILIMYRSMKKFRSKQFSSK